MAGLAWESVKQAADEADPAEAFVSDQDNNNNAKILAAAIVYARTGDESYRTKVVAACEQLLNAGYPVLPPWIPPENEEDENRTLAWARETGAYALAADLAGYRTLEFELWLRNMAESYVAADNRILLQMFRKRPNNWGTQGFGSLCAIYAFLQDTTRLTEVREYWMQSVLGPKPEEMVYGDDLSWHVDTGNLRLINPKGAVKQGLNIDGIMPDDMRRGASFSNPPVQTGYAWEALQGIISGARILERFGMPIWGVADSAIYRVGYALQVRWEAAFGGWRAEGDDLWMLAFFDDAYGTDWASGQPERVWQHGKNAGWPYVIWDGILGSSGGPGEIQLRGFELLPNYPNPFNPITHLRFYQPHSAHVRVVVYNLMGQEIATLLDSELSAGDHTLVWNTANRSRGQLSSGIYLCRMQSGTFNKVLKMTVLR